MSAAPSRRWAARMPARSTAFLQALGRAQGSLPRITLAPPSVRRSTIQTGVAASSISTALFGTRQLIQHARHRIRRPNAHRIAEMGVHLGQELAAVHEPVHVALAMNGGEGMGQGAVGDVGAPHVEQPGDRIGRAQHRGVGALLRKTGRDRLPLVAGLRAPRIARDGGDGAEGRRRLLRPERVDGVVLARDEARADGLARLRQPVATVRAVKPGVVAERGARRKVVPQPRIGGLVGDVAVLVEAAVHLRRRLQGVAPVDEERRLPGQHDRHARGAREAGEPGQALRAPCDVLALVLVAQRHHEAVEALPRERGPERGEPFAACCGVSIPSGALACSRRSASSRSAKHAVEPRRRDEPAAASSGLAALRRRCLAPATRPRRRDVSISGVGQRLGQRAAPLGCLRFVLRHGGVSASPSFTASISAWPSRPSVCGAEA